MPLITSNYSITGKRRWLYAAVALLLAIAQLFAQLHSLEHIDESDGDGHSELSCNICILSADLENTAPPEHLTLATYFQTSVTFVHDSTSPLFLSPNRGFDARAPPPPAVPQIS
jgi:hypothetical protein